jgi:glycosyltransferase 2 family protein
VVTEAARPDEPRSRVEQDHGESDVPQRSRRRWIGYIPLLFALGAIAALLVYADPHKIGIAFQRFNLVYIPVVVVLAVGFYLVQGVRWWTLNRALGITFPLRDTVFLTETGQATALLPLGELTRALLLSKAAAVHLGSVVASETVQELLFVFMLFALALPRALGLHLIAIAVVVPMLFVIAIVAILTIERLYSRVRRIIGRVPVLRRLRPAVDELHRDTRRLFRHPDTYRYLPLSAVQAAMAVSLLWAVAEAVDPGKLSWTSAGFVYAATQGAAWLSLAPGGLGAVEASTAGLLVLLGISFDIATAISVMQRLADKGLNTVIGWVCYLFARRRYNLTGASLFRFEMPRAEEAVGAGPN